MDLEYEEVLHETNITMKTKSSVIVRNIIFGVEDSLVSTVGLLSGIVSTHANQKTIFSVGIILVVVEAFSMAAGSFLSESSVEDFLDPEHSTPRSSFFGGVIMFFSYAIAGFIPLFPYAAFSIERAEIISIASSLISLFLLGVASAKVSQMKITSTALRMVLVGGSAIIIGMVAGEIIKAFQ